MAIAVAERVRDKNRNTMLQFRSMEKKGCSSAKLLLFSSYDSLLYFRFFAGCQDFFVVVLFFFASMIRSTFFFVK